MKMLWLQCLSRHMGKEKPCSNCSRNRFSRNMKQKPSRLNTYMHTHTYTPVKVSSNVDLVVFTALGYMVVSLREG